MTALSDALIYSSPLLGEMDFLEIAQIVAHEKCLWKQAGFLVQVHTLLHLLCVPLSLGSPASYCGRHQLLYSLPPPPIFGGCFLPQDYTHASFKTSNMLINTAYYYAAPTANLSSDSLLVTWSLCRIHQTSLPMCKARNWIFKQGSHWWTPWHLCLCEEIIFLVLPLYSGQ